MTPLLRATLAYAAGVLVGMRQPLTPLFALAFGALALLLFIRMRGVRPAAVFCTLGAVAGILGTRAVREDCRTRLMEGDVVHVVGVPASLSADGANTIVHARTLRVAGGISCGAVVVRVRARPPLHATLDSAALGLLPALTLRGRWFAYPQRSGWPRPPEYAGSLTVDSIGVDASGQFHGAGPRTRFAARQQQRLRAMLPVRWPLADALLLAQTATLSKETRERWVAAGLVHMLAISGMHVALIATGVLGLCAAAGLSRRTARRVALLVTAAYVLFLGAPSAALRALLQAAMLLCSLELQRPAEPFTALATAALAILLLDPIAVLNPGFQLSFAGMIGLIAWRRAIADRMPRRVPKVLRDGLATGIAASMLTTPIAALHFGTASWIGILATIPAAPVMAAAVALLLLALVFAALTGATTGLHAHAADLPLRLLDAIADYSARVPGGHALVSDLVVFAVLIGAAAAILARRAALDAAPPELPPPSHAPDSVHERYELRHRRRALRLTMVVASATMAYAWSPALLRPHDGRLEIHAIDVGQGDAFAVRTPRGRWLLVDAGPRSGRSDAGRDRVLPFLLQHGARRIDVLVLTHPHADHIGGAAAILDALPVGTVVDPGFPEASDMFVDLLAGAQLSGQRWVASRPGTAFELDGVTIELLYPIANLDDVESANDFSVVLRLVFGDFAALFFGDAPASVEETLVARHGDALRAAVLKVGHHGSATSTSAALLEAARPQLALVSNGRSNRYGHPAPGVLRRLEAHRVRVLRTDRIGNITVRAWRDGTTEVVAR